jgi:hypothetical protein
MAEAPFRVSGDRSALAQTQERQDRDDDHDDADDVEDAVHNRSPLCDICLKTLPAKQCSCGAAKYTAATSWHFRRSLKESAPYTS